MLRFMLQLRIYKQQRTSQMTKELSKKLCEIVGIKPRYGIYVNFGDLDNDYRLVTDERRYKLISDYRYQVDDEDLKGLKATFYPDFGQPENFVKLLEIAYIKSIYTGTPIGAFRNTKKRFQDCFFERLFARLEKLGNCFAGKDFKEAIREEEWKYE